MLLEHAEANYYKRRFYALSWLIAKISEEDSIPNFREVRDGDYLEDGGSMLQRIVSIYISYRSTRRRILGDGNVHQKNCDEFS
jgi:hypothetical protein